MIHGMCNTLPQNQWKFCILMYIYLKEQRMLHACFLQTNANGRAIPGPIIAFMVNIIWQSNSRAHHRLRRQHSCLRSRWTQSFQLKHLRLKKNGTSIRTRTRKYGLCFHLIIAVSSVTLWNIIAFLMALC